MKDRFVQILWTEKLVIDWMKLKLRSEQNEASEDYLNFESETKRIYDLLLVSFEGSEAFTSDMVRYGVNHLSRVVFLTTLFTEMPEGEPVQDAGINLN